MKKIKSTYSSGSGNKMMGNDPTMVSIKLDKMSESDPFVNNLNRKFGCQDGS